MKRLFYAAGIVLAAAAGYWAIAIAQPAAPSLAAIIPAGASLYLEAKDFAALLNAWNSSREKQAWVGSANYDAFSRSRLFYKLGQAQTEFAAAAGIPPDYAMLGSVAGGNSALAIYDIGNLEFIYVTRLASARALDTALWKGRTTYQTRSAAGVTYYLKQDAVSHRTAAFAYSEGTLLLATNSDLIAGALELMNRVQRPSIVGEPWYATATQAAQPGAVDLRMVYNLARLTVEPHFRSYWIQRNVAELRDFSAGVADLEQSSAEIRERRVLLRANSSSAALDETGAGAAMALVPPDAGFYRARLTPDTDSIQAAISEKIFGAGRAPAIESTSAPAIADQAQAGAEQELETRIDQAPLPEASAAFAPLSERLRASAIDAMVEVSSTRMDADQVFVRADSAVAVIAKTPWSADAMRLAIGSVAQALWSNGTSTLAWRTGAGGVQELNGLGHIAMAVDGRLLVIGNSPALVGAVYARRNTPAVPGALYAAGWRHSRELPNFERISRLIDFPQIPPATGSDQPREPMFFSESLASLGRALSRVQSVEITVHDAGPMLRENLIYRIAP
jgi:hypothetical protein